jgi:VWFA-related protein
LRLRCIQLTLLSICISAFSASHSSLAQAPTGDVPAPTPVFKANTQAVSIDVVVTKGSDQPVTGLHAQDFQVLEDGKPQKIDLFDERSAATTPALARPLLPPHFYTNQPLVAQSAAVNVLLLDSLNTPQPDQAFIHKQIANFLLKVEPGTRIAVFTLNTRLQLVQDFTADTAVLKAALDSKAAAPVTTHLSRTRNDDLRDKEEMEITGEISNTGGADSGLPVKSMADSLADQARLQAGQRSAITLAALQELGRVLAAVPGRKNLIWFARTFPVSIFPDGPNKQTLINGKDIGEAVRVTANLLTQAKVALYPVSAQGISVDRTTDSDSGGQPGGDAFATAPLQETTALNSNRAGMEQLASDTGGEALYVGNDLSKSLMRAIDNGSHYYTLVYTPTDKKLDGKFHRIEVKLASGGNKLSYRRGYFAANATETKGTPDPLPPLMAQGMPASTQILYEARLLPLVPQPAADAARAGGNTKLTGPFTRYKTDFIINPSNITLDLAADGTHSGRIEVALIAYDHEGHLLNWAGNTLALNLNATSYAQIQRVGIPVHLQIDLPQGDADLATGVYDLNGRKAGTLEIPVRAITGPAAP